jgi:signal transduction histidine kinase
VAAWHLVTIIEEVLSYSRSEAGRLELHRSTVDLASIARDVVDVLELEAGEKGLDLRLEGADQPGFLFSDAGKVRQVVTNLVGNAVKFTDEGEVVFEPFTQGDSTPTRSKGGVGLRLAISRRLARLLGGDIELESRPGRGSTFTLRLPRDPK